MNESAPIVQRCQSCLFGFPRRKASEMIADKTCYFNPVDLVWESPTADRQVRIAYILSTDMSKHMQAGPTYALISERCVWSCGYQVKFPPKLLKTPMNQINGARASSRKPTPRPQAGWTSLKKPKSWLRPIVSSSLSLVATPHLLAYLLAHPSSLPLSRGLNTYYILHWHCIICIMLCYIIFYCTVLYCNLYHTYILTRNVCILCRKRSIFGKGQRVQSHSCLSLTLRSNSSQT